jgi:hypothetical protein
MSTFSGKATQKQLKKELSIPDHMEIGFACKLGYPITETKSVRVRREMESFTHHNKYEKKA